LFAGVGFEGKRDFSTTEGKFPELPTNRALTLLAEASARADYKFGRGESLA